MAFKVNYEQIVNGAQTPLTAGINASTTTIPVTTGSVFPTVGDFRIIIDFEIMLVTARTGNNLTVVRGVEGTTAVSHLIAANVTGIFTKASVTEYIKNFAPFYNARPLMHSLTDSSGNILTRNSFSWVNQGSATVDDGVLGGLVMNIPRTTFGSLRILDKAAPSTPYTITAAVSNSSGGKISAIGDFVWTSIGFREASSGKLLILLPINNYEIDANRYNSPTSVTNVLALTKFTFNPKMQWIRIEDDGTNLNLYLSNNGIEWMQMYSELRGSFFTTAPDRVCFISNGKWSTIISSDVNHRGQLLHWSEA